MLCTIWLGPHASAPIAQEESFLTFFVSPSATPIRSFHPFSRPKPFSIIFLSPPFCFFLSLFYVSLYFMSLSPFLSLFYIFFSVSLFSLPLFLRSTATLIHVRWHLVAFVTSPIVRDQRTAQFWPLTSTLDWKCS